MKTFVILAEHHTVPGIVVDVHETRAGALVQAIALADVMWRDAGKKGLATDAGNYERRLEMLQDEYGAAHCYVEIHEKDTQA